ncbi:MFS transporter [Cryobacterium sp. Hb1]|nr:MFS transporter [Cryobacterium sp. Hb1]
MTQALSQPPVNAPQKTPKSRIKRVVAASMAGTVAEWYEFFIYGTAATLVFGSLFFPKTGNPLDGIIAAFATYAVGFLARPLGGMVFGHFGDRYGRKKLLQFSLLLVGAATFLMGCLPGFQEIGYWAPALLVLLRFLQGFAVGGEWGGAVLLVSEHSPQNQRGFWASFPQAAAPVGNVLATVVMLGLSWTLDQSSFMAWGWRIAFWLSALIIFVGYMIRRTVEDAPVFIEAMRKQREAQREAATLREVLRTYPAQITKALIMRIGENSSYYLMIVFAITYLTVHVKVEYSTVLLVLFVANIVQFFAMLGGGWLSDKIGRKRTIGIGYVGLLVWALTFFPALDSGNFWAILASTTFGLTVQAAAYAPQAALMSEIFPTRMRYSGSSFTYQIATIFAGSVAPMIATLLLNQFNNTLPIVIYVVGILIISTVALSMLKETRGLDLSSLDRIHENELAR